VRGRRQRRFVVGQAARTLVDLDVIVGRDVKASHLADDPVVGQFLGPAGIGDEPRHLRGRWNAVDAAPFGEPFKEYCARVPRLLPRIASLAGEGRFSFGQVLYNREYNGLMGTLIIVVLFALIAFKLHQAPYELIAQYIP
jgi:hypothetical protein